MQPLTIAFLLMIMLIIVLVIGTITTGIIYKVFSIGIVLVIYTVIFLGLFYKK